VGTSEGLKHDSAVWCDALVSLEQRCSARLFVSVERGSVRLLTADHALEVGAGQSASVGSDGTPRLETDASAAPRASDLVQADRQRAVYPVMLSPE
jgi:hypothetical protein